MRGDVLKAGLRLNGMPQWAANSLSDARDAVENECLVCKIPQVASFLWFTVP